MQNTSQKISSSMDLQAKIFDNFVRAIPLVKTIMLWSKAILFGMVYFVFLFLVQKTFLAYSIGSGHEGYIAGFALTLVMLVIGVFWSDYRRKRAYRKTPPQEHQPVYRTKASSQSRHTQSQLVKRQATSRTLFYKPEDYSLGA